MLQFELNHESFMIVIGKPFEGKKLLNRWMEWQNATDTQKAKNPNARGKWIPYLGTAHITVPATGAK